MTTRSQTRAFTLVELMMVIGIIILLVAITAAVSTSLIRRSEIQRTESVLSLLTAALEDYRLAADRDVSMGEDNLPPGAIYDLHPDTPHIASVAELLAVIGRMPSVKTALAQIPEELIARFSSGGSGTPDWLSPGDPDDPDPNAGSWGLTDFNDLSTRHPSADIVVVLDAWETPIRLIHPGRVRDSIPGVNDPEPPTWPAWTRDASGSVKEDDGTIFINTTAPHNGLELFYGMARNRKICFVSAGPDGKFGEVGAAVDSDAYQQTLDNIYSYQVVRP